MTNSKELHMLAVINGGRGDDFFDGSSGSGQDEQYLWVGGSGANRYKSPRENTIVVVDEKSPLKVPTSFLMAV